MDQINFDKKFTAIKLHFGEPGNLAFLRPNYARTVVDLVRQLGGRPFLTDCNTLYVGRRKDALEHLESAYQNGFNPYNVGCHLIIGDGLKGTDDVEIPVDGDYVRKAKIGRAIADADIFISLTHFKAHEAGGIGGTIKNIGMGCGSRAGKMEMHSNGKPGVNADVCIGCRSCAKACAHGAPQFVNKKMHIDYDKCVGCGRCIGVCPTQALERDANGVVQVRKDKCTSCLMCVGFCPSASMFFDGDKQTEPFKCIACGICARKCPTGALELVNVPAKA